MYSSASYGELRLARGQKDGRHARGELREEEPGNERSGGRCGLIGWRWIGRDPEVGENWRRWVRGFGGWDNVPRF